MTDITKTVRKEVFFFTLNHVKTWDIAVKKLEEGFRQIERHEATSMFFNIQFGMLLETAFQTFKVNLPADSTWSGLLS
jgi:hypothetical protein